MSNTPPTRLHNNFVLLVSAVLLLTGMWVSSQGGFANVNPGKFAAVIMILLDASPVLLTLWLGAAGLGFPLRRLLLPTEMRLAAAVQVAMGMAALLLIYWSLAWAGMTSMWTGWGVGAVGVALLGAQAVYERKRVRWFAENEGGLRLPWTLTLAMPGLAVLLVAACCPPGTLWRVEAMGYDVLSYHMQLPREWLAAGQMAGLRHNVYSYFPSLLEAGYMQIAAMRGSAIGAVYVCQLFHASFAIFAAAAIACTAANFVRWSGAVVGAAVFLSLPWVIITGSLAYNEMAVIAFAAASLIVLFDVANERWYGATAIGLLLGASVLVKLTAGFMVAVPIGIVLLTRLNHALRWRKPREWPVGARSAVIAAVAALVVVSPYLVRNYTWTGNPVFPFATSHLGKGHWDDTLAIRWNKAHGLSWDGQTSRPDALARQWLLNVGYGAVAGHATPRETQNIARFDAEGGIPVLWVAVLIAAALTVSKLGMRRAVAAMAVVLIAQLAFWLLATHLQSRFLIFTLMPATVLVGIGAGRLAEMTEGGRLSWLRPVLVVALVATLFFSSFTVFLTQTRSVLLADGTRVNAGPTDIIDSMADPKNNRPGLVGDHPINHLPANSKTYLVADNSSLFYIRRPFVYHTAFDASQLGQMMRDAQYKPASVNQLLKDAGITHVWVGWSELDRLHSTYGYDASVTERSLKRLIDSGWQPVRIQGQQYPLYKLP